MPKIHNLPPLTDDPAIADVLPMDDDSVADPSSPNKTKKITLEQIRDFILGQFAVGVNQLINGNFDVWQRGTSFTQNDDLYIADRWNALQEANSSWTFARDTSVPDAGSRYSLKCSNATANNQCALVYILENADAQQLLGQNVSLSFYAKTTSLEISNLRVAILSWTGTADSVTSDVISTWAQNGTNPTWAASWTLENTPSNLALTNSYQKFTIENVAIDTAGMKNLAVVIWVDDGTIASGDDFWISQVMLNTGGTAADFVARPYAQELEMCQRYCLVRQTAGTAQTTVSGTGNAAGTTRIWAPVANTTPFRVTPTLTATAADWQGADGVSAGLDATAIAISADPAGTPDNPFIQITVSGASSKTPYIIRGDGGSNRTLIYDAEL